MHLETHQRKTTYTKKLDKHIRNQTNTQASRDAPKKDDLHNETGQTYNQTNTQVSRGDTKEKTTYTKETGQTHKKLGKHKRNYRRSKYLNGTQEARQTRSVTPKKDYKHIRKKTNT